jgi:hypothetical protein
MTVSQTAFINHRRITVLVVTPASWVTGPHIVVHAAGYINFNKTSPPMLGPSPFRAFTKNWFARVLKFPAESASMTEVVTASSAAAVREPV